MSYTLRVIPFALASGPIPSMLGSLFFPPPPSGSIAPPLDTALSTPPSLILTFPSAVAPPPGTSAVLVQDTGTQGDLFRSGPMAGTEYPPSPVDLQIVMPSLLVVPPAALNARVATWAAAQAGSPIPISASITASISALTGFQIIPLRLTISSASLAVTPPGLTLTVNGTFVARQFLFFTITHAYTMTFTVTPAPSGDPTETLRVLRMTASSPILVATGVPNFVTALLAPILIGFTTPMLESAINFIIASTARSVLSSMGLRQSPTSVICAQSVAVRASSGVALNLVFSDIRGFPLVPIPILGNLAIAVSPVPQADKLLAYTFTVTDLDTGAPVSQANVLLHNFDANASPQSMTATTNAQGHVSFHVSLHPKIITGRGGDGGPIREPVFIPPTVMVLATGYYSLTTALLEDLNP